MQAWYQIGDAAERVQTSKRIHFSRDGPSVGYIAFWAKLNAEQNTENYLYDKVDRLVVHTDGRAIQKPLPMMSSPGF